MVSTGAVVGICAGGAAVAIAAIVRWNWIGKGPKLNKETQDAISSAQAQVQVQAAQ